MNLRRKKIAYEIISTNEIEISLKSYFPMLLIDEDEWLMNPSVICKTSNFTTHTHKKKNKLVDMRNCNFYCLTFFEKNLEEY